MHWLAQASSPLSLRSANAARVSRAAACPSTRQISHLQRGRPHSQVIWLAALRFARIVVKAAALICMGARA